MRKIPDLQHLDSPQSSLLFLTPSTVPVRGKSPLPWSPFLSEDMSERLIDAISLIYYTFAMLAKSIPYFIVYIL